MHVSLNLRSSQRLSKRVPPRTYFMKKYILKSFWKTYSIDRTNGLFVWKRMSFSFFVLCICFLFINTFLLILFMAYNYPEYFWITKKTLPNDPLSITLMILKSFSLHLGMPSFETRQEELDSSICISSFFNFSYLLYLSRRGRARITKSSKKSDSSFKTYFLFASFGLE